MIGCTRIHSLDSGQEHEQALFPFPKLPTLAAVKPIKRYGGQFDTDPLEREKFVCQSVGVHATRKNSMK